ncbi:alpha-1,2-mannosidase, putative [Lentzea albidocapillata subsp. violacea]|uniref:Alpha-1,2-mannosidase, putative n=1 Tax=Lentzea albidocapillata subsp. violacea TaxID=128104 RepID=A0A1G9KYE4_9PSEU|nr:GH92 family glycosyl hydrolase [Lentzea albidocapillata]SDL54731.1 alpha-1,2-mannosidase, putative [Lentzea albidocapillata subsp. violacea]
MRQLGKRRTRSLLSVAITATLVCGVTNGYAAAAPEEPGVGFSSSFEEGQPQPSWANTVETDAAGNPKSAGVVGSDGAGIPGNVSDKVLEVKANGEFADSNEVKENLVDGSVNTKWLVFTNTGWASFRFGETQTIRKYALTSANDAPERNPRDWTLQGSANGTDWTVLDTRTDVSFTDEPFQTRLFDVASPAAYSHYKLDITRNNGSPNIIQLAEVQLSDGSTSPTPPNMRSVVGNGPTGGYTAKARVGWTGVRAFRYQGRHTAEGRGYSYNKVFDVDIAVQQSTELSYLIFPNFVTDNLGYPSTYASVDLAFSDGTYLSDLQAVDQHGAVLSPQGQGAGKFLYANQWNKVASTIGAVAAGKTIKRILVAYDGPKGPTEFGGWLDDVTITDAPVRKEYAKPSDYVLTTRGTNSNGSFSRGNNFPATAVPHGFNFWTPMTNAGSTSWLYEYQQRNNDQNLPTLQAFTASHEPSPWMGDRQTFQVMPSDKAPTQDRALRALPFKHDNEVAKAHYYGVTFENGIKTEIAPTDHAAVFRFTFNDEAQKNVVFDNVSNAGGLTLDAGNGVVSGYSDVRIGSAGTTRMFVYGKVDKPVTASGRLTGAGRDNVGGYFSFADKSVELRIATSLISVDQARSNLEQEIGGSDTFDSVRDRAQTAWDKVLGIISVEGATEDQLITMYSNMYRLYLYPNSGFEQVGDKFQYASPVSPATGQNTPTRTGAKIVDGKIYVNNGFWDTYRTTWPAYSLFTPSKAGEMAEGFVQQYKDGGWISRWSSPGYADLMTGTSSDVAFADAYLKGVSNFDIKAAYDAAVKNASVVPPNSAVGRKGMDRSIFLGWTGNDQLHEAWSWAIEGYLNDFGIASMAKSLHEKTGEKRYLEEHEYFLNRAQNYVLTFDKRIDFFQGRNVDGSWRVEDPAKYNPQEWRYDYTETNGWNMAFTVPHDGQGLANLYGGRDKLASKLDEFFTLPETAKFPGGYGGVIHEMIEARDVRMGQYGHSNQPSHHIPYMYNYAGKPSRTQEKVREILSRLYVGSEQGQGYAGDEDNGEMSAWHLFSSLGFYPLQMGKPAYAIGSPLFTKATVKLENGKKLVINAPKNNAKNIYVQGVKVNGKAWNKTSLPHDLLSAGATIDFDMGPKPSAWGTGANDVPESITTGDAVPTPLRDVASDVAVGALVDNNSSTSAVVSSFDFKAADAKEKAEFYTLTNGKTGTSPSAWELKGSYDGKTWSTVDKRSGENFQWQQYTRSFKIASPGRYSFYRLEFSGDVTLAEFELMSKPLPAATTTVTGTVNGPLEVKGVTYVDGATISGPVTVARGATLYVFGGEINGPLSATDAASVVLVGTKIGGPVTVHGSSSEVAVENSVVGGPVSLTSNKTRSVVAATSVGGPLSCTGNDPAPSNNGFANDVKGPKAGQCAGL